MLLSFATRAQGTQPQRATGSPESHPATLLGMTSSDMEALEDRLQAAADAEKWRKKAIDLEKLLSRTTPSGLKWRRLVLGAAPSNPQRLELVNEKLSSALESKHRFSQEEWDSFGVEDLQDFHFVRSGITAATEFFEPIMHNTTEVQGYEEELEEIKEALTKAERRLRILSDSEQHPQDSMSEEGEPSVLHPVLGGEALTGSLSLTPYGSIVASGDQESSVVEREDQGSSTQLRTTMRVRGRYLMHEITQALQPALVTQLQQMHPLATPRVFAEKISRVLRAHLRECSRQHMTDLAGGSVFDEMELSGKLHYDFAQALLAVQYELQSR